MTRDSRNLTAGETAFYLLLAAAALPAFAAWDRFSEAQSHIAAGIGISVSLLIWAAFGCAGAWICSIAWDRLRSKNPAWLDLLIAAIAAVYGLYLIAISLIGAFAQVMKLFD